MAAAGPSVGCTPDHTAAATTWEDIADRSVRASEYRTSGLGGWTFRTCKSHILESGAACGFGGHYAWKRELQCFQGQSLPDALWDRNSLEVVHEPTGVRIRFCALEALRSWAGSDHPHPIPKVPESALEYWKSNRGTVADGDNDGERIIPPYDYDYTYTTTYAGGTDTVNDNNNDNDNDNNHNYTFLQPDSNSFLPRRVETADATPAGGNSSAQRTATTARLRKPLCKCKGDGGRAPFLANGATGANQITKDHHKTTAPTLLKNRAPKWTMIDDGAVNTPPAYTVEDLLREHPVPAHRDEVDLYRDDLHDCGTSFLKAKVYVAPNGSWAVLLRCFVRVDGVMARVVDTRYVYRHGDNHDNDSDKERGQGHCRQPKVFRERSWREGTWDTVLGRTTGTGTGGVTNGVAPRGDDSRHRVSNEHLNDSLAARVLPLTRPAVTEALTLQEDPPLIPTPPERRGGTIVDANKHKLPSPSSSSTYELVCRVPDSVANGCGGISMIAVFATGGDSDDFGTGNQTRSMVQAFGPRAADGGSALWTKDLCPTSGHDDANDNEDDGSSNNRDTNMVAQVLALHVSPNPSDGGRIVLGDDRGWGSVWRLSTGECLFDFPVSATERKRVGGTSSGTNTTIDQKGKQNTQPTRRRNVQTASLWVEAVVFGGDYDEEGGGGFIGAAAGRSAVLVSAVDGTLLSSVESAAGTVTAISFVASGGNVGIGSTTIPGGTCTTRGLPVLGVASYGEVQWLAATTTVGDSSSKEGENNNPEPWRREGAAVQCMDASPDGTRVAVGFLDKTVRVFGRNNDSGDETTAATIDWVGFNSPVEALTFSRGGGGLGGGGGRSSSSSSWLAAMAGSAILVLTPKLLASASDYDEPPIVCRTPGQTGPDGRDGLCHRFNSVMWSQRPSVGSYSYSCREGQGQGTLAPLLIAVDMQARGGGAVHVFDVEQSDQAWPRRAVPIITVTPYMHFPRAGPFLSKPIQTYRIALQPPRLGLDDAPGARTTASLENGSGGGSNVALTSNDGSFLTMVVFPSSSLLVVIL